ncbi:MAG: PQQ-dependent sugar dehydrogenase [Bryobacteraceae bacterium]
MRLIAIVSLVAAAFAAEVKLPPPFHSPSAQNRPKVIARPDGSRLQVPQGFEVEVFAEGFDVPRIMILGPSKEILMSDAARNGAGAVYLLKPERRKLIEKLDRPYGMAFWKDYLYVAEPASVKRYKYDAKAMKAGPGEEVVSLKDFGQGHWTRSITFDKDGKKMYVGVGSGSNVDAGEAPMRAAINRFNPDGSGHEIYASGTRNPTQILWYPGTQTLWAAVQERDLLGDDLVPDFFTHIQQSAFYGWPYAYIGPNEDPRRKGEKPDLVKKTTVPDVVLGAHVAVLDAIFYTGKQFPKAYQGGAFLAFHGSWNRSQRVGYSLVYIPFSKGKPSGPIKEFLTGWMLAPDKPEVWGRPVGILQMTDGSLLVSDDGGKKIWRISYKGK